MNNERYFLQLAAAFVRGKLGAHKSETIFSAALEDLSEEEQEELFKLGNAAELRMHKFKRTMDLPRVKRVIGILKGMQIESLLDIGSGRGAFLWSLLAEFGDLNVCCVDIRDDRVEDILAARRGGLSRLDAKQADARQLDFADESFDVVCLLEVLEHMPEPEKAFNEALRVCRRAVIISVPSHEDDNPEHIHLFNRNQMEAMILSAGARPRFDSVFNHTIVVCSKAISQCN